MTDKSILLTKDGPVATLMLNRPNKRNALSEGMWRAIADQAGRLADDPSIKVVIVRGADASAFSAGADIAEFDRVHASPETADAYRQVVDSAYQSLAGLEKPTIAMIQGVCFGGGCALSLCCDLRYADPSASFCIPPAKLGLVYSLQETKRLADLVGPSKAKEMLMGAYVVDAEEALRIGLATRLFDAGELERETYGFARHLAGLSQATIRGVKAMMAEIANGAAADTDVSRRLAEAQFESADYIEGRRAFLEKRKPNFS
ncbi:MAG: enoyl-CoA hydratase-related protein [Alphaproteobacteria bacterium]|nr:enoyl-CoA hydratase-related protein [Alphaproteobacteria bacterium]